MKDKKQKAAPETEDPVKNGQEAATETEDTAPAQETPEVKTAPEADEWHDRFIRLAADFDNYKKHAKAEKDGIYTAAKADAVEELLPVVDNIERALAAAEDSPLKSGVEMILTQVNKSFEKLGVCPIGEPGDPFDPQIHNAVMHVDDESLGENTVAEVLQRGYRIGDKVIRHALVKVAN